MLKQWGCRTLLLLVIATLTGTSASAGQVGLSTPGSNIYPNDLPRRSSTVSFRSGEDDTTGSDSYFGMIGDAASGYIYVTANTTPAKIDKIAVGIGNAAPTRVGILKLQAGESHVENGAFIDPVAGFGYFILAGTPSKIVKVALGVGDAAPTRVGELLLSTAEVAQTAVVDPINGYAYLGTNQSPGRVVKINLRAADFSTARLGAITLLDDIDNSNDENNLSASCIDLSAKYAYFATQTAPSIIVKVSLGEGSALPTRVAATKLNSGEDSIVAMAIDKAKGYMYAGSAIYTGFNLGSGVFVKLAITDDAAPAVRKAAISVIAERLSIDTVNGCIYASSRQFFFGNELRKIELQPGDTTPTVVANVNIGTYNFFTGFIDTTAGYFYLRSYGMNGDTSKGNILKMSVTTGSTPPSIISRIGFSAGGQDFPLGLTLNPANNQTYCVTNTRSGSVLQTDAGAGNADPVFAATTPVNTSNVPASVVTDVSDGYMYVGITDNLVKKIRLNPLGFASSGSSGLTADFPRVALIDTIHKYAYFCSGNSSHRFSKMRLNAGSNAAPTGLGDISIATDASTGVIDAQAGFAYVVLPTTPNSIVKIQLGAGDALPSIVGTLVLNSGDVSISCGVLDPVNKFACFGTSATPSKIIMIDLNVADNAVPIRVGSCDLLTGENSVNTATFDPLNRCAYFGTFTQPAKVIKVGFPVGSTAPVRQGVITLQQGEDLFSSSTIDPNKGYAYFSSSTAPGRITKVATSTTGRMRATRVFLPTAASLSDMRFYVHGAPAGYSGSNKLRFSIYNNATPKQLLWQSGEIQNSTADGEIPPVAITSGTPSIVTLQPGTYWLAWQSEAAVNIPSYTPGNFGDGFYVDQSFGSAASTLSGEVPSNERWTQYFTFVNSPAPLAQFSLSGSINLVAGVAGNLTITAQDIYGTTRTDYTGTHAVTFSGANPSTSPVTQALIASGMLNAPRNVVFTNGVATVPMTLYKAEVASITASSAGISQIAPLSVTVTPAIDSKVSISGATTQVAGTAQTITLVTQDAFGNEPNTFNGSLNIDFSGAGNSPSGVTPSAAGVGFANVPLTFTNGSVPLPLMLVKAENATLIATPSGNFTPSLPFAISVVPAGAASLQLSNTGPVIQKQATSITLTAKDTFGNAASTYAGTVAYISTDPLAILPANQTLIAGQGATGLSKSVTLKTTSTQLVTVTDTVNGALTQTISLNVAPGIIANDLNISVFESNPVAVTLLATDILSSPLNFSVVTPPQNGTLSGTAPALTYTPRDDYSGPDSFTYRANDGSLNSNIANVSITIATLPSNKIPAISALSANTGSVSQSAFNLVVTGTNFSSGAVVRWNGVPLSTTFNSSTQLTAQVTSVQLASAGRIPVTVSNAVPELATSNSITFFLYSGSIGTWVVTNTNDSGQGSLRLALASVRNGDSVIFDPTVFDLVNSDAETLINVLSELPPMDDGNVTIDASNRRVSVNGSGANSARGLVVNSDNNTIRGLTLLGFARSGISLLPGAANNSIGGGRSVGGGPNGQGLRISGNGTYGIEILGAGTTGNVVKGCWIGLDAGGSGAQPNLAGIIIGDGATGNTIGSTASDEENIISGNSLEGVTVAGTGTNDNIVIGNTVGASATILSTRAVQSREGLPSRGAVANGSAGLFLSKGTNGTKNGGTSTGEGNNVAFNGGNGVEVRSPNARRNSARGNRVTANSRGGIALFDGSNDNIKAPVVESFLRLATKPTTSTLGRSAVSARVKGSAVGSGQIEFFNDSGAQGAIILGRSTVSNGAFEADIDVDDLLNLTATFTDENGNTSPFGFFGRASGNAGTEDDTDGDGFSNLVETLAGTDPLNAAQAPVSAGTLAVDSSRISLNFASTNKDSLAAMIRVALPDGFELSQSTAGLLFGAVSKNFTLDSKLRSPKAVSTLKALKSKSGPGAVFSFSLKNEDLRAGLSASGLTNSTTAKTGDNKTVAVMLTLKSAAGASYAYAGTVTLTYKATQGKSGKAANAK